ncbi:hypothetical protein Dimus_011472 [Dionaea muscipula]
MADSVMMWILHSAMNKAHDKVRSKELGVIERLCEQSKFYELAIMQLEACVKFLQEEAGGCRFLENVYYEKLLSDLAEVGDRLRRRLRVTESAMAEKDKEMVERPENELKLRQKLERRENELQKLRGADHIHRGKLEESNKEGEFCEIKQSVDQQFLNIKQHLEDEKINRKKRWSQLGSPSSINQDSECDSEVVHDTDLERVTRILDQKGNLNDPSFADHEDDDAHDVSIDQMEFEVDKLKETLDMAFLMMQDSGIHQYPVEMQWRWMVEKDTMSTLLTGFIGDIMQQNLEHVVKRKEIEIIAMSSLEEQYRSAGSLIMDEMAGLRSDLIDLVSSNEVELPELCENVHVDVKKSSSMKNELEEAIYLYAVKRQPEEEEEEDDDDLVQGIGGNLVARMVKNHESIIKQKSKRFEIDHIIKGGDSSSRRNNDIDIVKKRVVKIIERLDDFETRNAGLISSLLFPSDRWIAHDKQNVVETKDVGMQMGNVEIRANEFDDQVKAMREQLKESSLQVMISEEIQTLAFGCLLRALQTQLCDQDIEDSVRQFLGFHILKEMVEDANMYANQMAMKCYIALEDYKSESYLMEEIFHLVLSDIFEGIGSSSIAPLRHCQKDNNTSDTMNEQCEPHCGLESSVREDVCTIFLKEMENAVEVHKSEALFKEEMYSFVLREKVKEVSVLHGQQHETQIAHDGSCMVHKPMDFEVILRHEDQSSPFNPSEFGAAAAAARPSNLRFALDSSPFLEGFPDFELILHQKLDVCCSRLEKIKGEIDPLTGLVVSLRKMELLYRQAFLRRCENLQKAEAEVKN